MGAQPGDGVAAPPGGAAPGRSLIEYPCAFPIKVMGA